jgi:hypothetical protein
MIALFGVHFGNAMQCCVIGFGSTAGEYNFFGVGGINGLGNSFTCFFNSFFGVLIKHVAAAGGVVKFFHEKRFHGFKHSWVEWRGGLVVQVNHAFFNNGRAVEAGIFGLCIHNQFPSVFLACRN